MDVVTETVSEFHHGNLTVGTAVATLPALLAYKGVKLKAGQGNAGTISVGGYVLAAGEEIEIPVDRFDRLRITASQASQRLHYLVV